MSSDKTSFKRGYLCGNPSFSSSIKMTESDLYLAKFKVKTVLGPETKGEVLQSMPGRFKICHHVASCFLFVLISHAACRKGQHSVSSLLSPSNSQVSNNMWRIRNGETGNQQSWMRAEGRLQHVCKEPYPSCAVRSCPCDCAIHGLARLPARKCHPCVPCTGLHESSDLAQYRVRKKQDVSSPWLGWFEMASGGAPEHGLASYMPYFQYHHEKIFAPLSSPFLSRWCIQA